MFHYIISQKRYNAYIRESLYDLCILVDHPPYYNEPSRLSWWLILLLTLATVNNIALHNIEIQFCSNHETLTIRNWGFSEKKTVTLPNLFRIYSEYNFSQVIGLFVVVRCCVELQVWQRYIIYIIYCILCKLPLFSFSVSI